MERPTRCVSTTTIRPPTLAIPITRRSAYALGTRRETRWPIYGSKSFREALEITVAPSRRHSATCWGCASEYGTPAGRYRRNPDRSATGSGVHECALQPGVRLSENRRSEGGTPSSPNRGRGVPTKRADSESIPKSGGEGGKRRGSCPCGPLELREHHVGPHVPDGDRPKFAGSLKARNINPRWVNSFSVLSSG